LRGVPLEPVSPTHHTRTHVLKNKELFPASGRKFKLHISGWNGALLLDQWKCAIEWIIVFLNRLY
jgi:hypothetical protein